MPPELAEHPRYRVVQVLGIGGMGSMYQAEHRLMQRLVALKVIRRRWMHSVAAVKRFRQEVRAATRLVHPNIVTAYDAEQAGGLHFLVMECIDGISLARLVQERGALPVAQAWTMSGRPRWDCSTLSSRAWSIATSNRRI